jgi:hypothetical protein
VLRDLRSDVGLGSMIAALAPQDQPHMGHDRADRYSDPVGRSRAGGALWSPGAMNLKCN